MNILTVAKWIGIVVLAETGFALGWSLVCLRAKRREAERVDLARRVVAALREAEDAAALVAGVEQLLRFEAFKRMVNDYSHLSDEELQSYIEHPSQENPE